MEDRPAMEDFYVPPDADDPFPQPTPDDIFWAYANRAAENFLWFMRVIGFICIVAGFTYFFLLMQGVGATWRPEFSLSEPEVQKWFESQTLTKAAREHFPFTSCCSHSDRFETTFKVDKSNGEDQWSYLVDGKWVLIPDYVIHYEGIGGEGKRFDQLRAEGILYIYQGKPTCFWPPDGGG